VPSIPDALRQRFEALVFDWDGTAVPDRASDAAAIRELVEHLCQHGMHVAVVSGTHVGNVDGQLAARPDGPGRLLLALNRGSEVFAVDRDGPRLVERRTATTLEDRALDAAAADTVTRLAARGLRAEIVSARLNRRKIDLIPEPEWHDPPKAAIDRLLDAVTGRLHASGIGGLAEAVTVARDAARDAGLPGAKVTSDVKHVEIGLTDKGDSARWLFEFLRHQGVGPGLVLIAGDEFGDVGGIPGSDSMMLVPEAARATTVSVGVEPTGTPSAVLHVRGGPERFAALLADQLERRRRGEVPRVDEDPAWTITFDGLDPERERTVEALLTLADGRLGTRGSPLVFDANTNPSVFAAGVYDGTGPHTTLLTCPAWHRLMLAGVATAGLRRVLDLRTGLLHESYAAPSPIRRSLRFSSLARPASVALRAECPAGMARTSPALVAPDAAGPADTGHVEGRAWLRVAASAGGAAAAASQRAYPHGSAAEVLERLGTYVADPEHLPDAAAALDVLAELEHTGFEGLLDEHRSAWARRWADAEVTIEGDDALQLAARFALFHLLASVATDGEAAVGARGLTGAAYRGHVFWDADVFVLPVLAAINPPAARAILEYRIRRLPAARAAATAEGGAGARFPWESARSGRDVTPSRALDLTGRVVPIRTGPLEVHIVGCVAWAAAHYLDWTGDTDFEAGAGGELLVETARYWASRVCFDAERRAHINGVIGPDEYHVPVDDNAFTNVLARWNLRRAALLDHSNVADEERTRWLEIADALVDGYDPATGLYEQFAGFFALEPLIIAEVAPRRPIAADLLLGAERVQQAQIVKQADVLMLHHLLPDEVARGSLEPNLDYYEPRTAHGSSLSPGVHASLLARAGRLDQAMTTLVLAGRLDLDDITATTAGGVHLAEMGSVWQALAFGFLGAGACGDALALDPRVPTAWSALEMRLRYRGTRLTVRAEAERLRVVADAPLHIVLGGTEYTTGTAGLAFGRSGTRWQLRHDEPERKDAGP